MVKKITIIPPPSAIGEGQDESIHQSRTGKKIANEYATDMLTKGHIIVNLPENELSTRLVNLYRKSRTALQEGGANTLYLALTAPQKVIQS